MKSIPTRFRVLSSSAAALVAALVLQPAPAQAVFDYVTGTYTETFDLLGPTGLTTSTLTSWTTDGSSPWTIDIRGGAQQLALATGQTLNAVSDGNTAVNNPAARLFNDGAANAVDRALGTGNTSGDPTIDLAVRNGSGRALDAVKITFDTEFWRGGSSAAAVDFGYSLLYSPTGAAGTWVAMNAVIPTLNPAANAVLDGNAAANRATTSIIYTLPGEAAAGAGMFFRWLDTNDPTDSPDANIAIDNVQFSAFANLVYNPSHTVGGAPNGAITLGGGEYWLRNGAPAVFGDGDLLTFSQDATATVDVPANVNVAGLNFTHFNGTYTVGGAGVITGALSKTGVGDVVLVGANQFTSATFGGGGKITIQNNSGLATAGPLTINDSGITLELNGDATVRDGLNGAGPLTKTGPGALILTGTAAGTGTGGINLQGGTIRLGTSASSGAATQVTNISNNATLEWNVTGDSNPGAKPFNILAGGATLSSTLAAQGNAVIFNTANTFTGTEPVTKAGVGVLRFTAVQGNLSSPWIVNQGAIETTVTGGFGTGAITVNPGGLIVMNGAAAINIPNNITLAGGAIGVRSGNLGTYGTPTSTINVTADSFFSVRSNSTQANGQTYIVAALLSGSAGITVTGPATANFGGATLTNLGNTYSGNISVNARNFLSLAPTGGTGNVLGTGHVTLLGGTLNVLDNGAGNNGTIDYSAHNLTAGAPSDVLFPSTNTLNLNRQSGANSGNRVNFGSLTIGADPFTIASISGYAVSFTGATLTGSATINSGDMTVHLGPISGGAFDLTRNGTGTLNLTGASTTTGTIRSTGGTVNVSGSLAGSVNVAGTTLKVSGPVAGSVTAADSVVNIAAAIGGGLAATGTTTITGTGSVAGAVSIGNGVTITPGDAQHHGAIHFGALTFGAAAGDAATINFNTDSVAANRGYIESGALAVANGSTVTLNLLNALPAMGFYPILDYSGATIDAATFAAFTLAPIANPRITAVLNHNTANNIIELNVLAVDAPRWTGAGNGVWTTAVQTPKNWSLIIGGGATDFMVGDEVLFDNSAANKIVSLTAQDVSPSRVTFNNSGAGNNYTLNGTFAIAGAGSLVKSGTADLTINNSNSFTGSVSANGGTIHFSSLADSGVNSSLGAGSVINFDGGTLDYTGPLASTNRALTVGAGGGTFTQNGSGEVTLAGDLSGPGIFTKSGPGKLILTGPASTVGGVNIAAGALQIGDGVAAGGAPGSGPIVNSAQLILNPGADLALANTISGAGTITKEGPGNATLGGILPNTYTGVTTVNGGTLFGGKPNGVNAVGGDLVINVGGTFRYTGDNTRNQIADTASVLVDGGTFGDPLNVNPVAPGYTDTIASLTVSNAGAFASGRNTTLTPFTITGATKVNSGGSILAQRAGGITTDSLLVEAGSFARMDGGGTTAGEESRINVGAGGLTLNDGQVVFNSGPSAITATSVGSILTLNGNVTSTGTSTMTRPVGDLALKGEINLGAGVRNFNVTGELAIGGVGLPVIISGAGGINKTGDGLLKYTGAGTFTGGTTITGGQLMLINGVPGTGPLVLNANPLLVETTVDTAITNTISGPGGMIKTGAGAFRYQGAESNTYTGKTEILAGTFTANKPAGIIAIPGDLDVAAGAIFRFSGNVYQNQIADTSNITVSGTFGVPTATEQGVGDTVNSVDVKSGGTFVSGRNMVTVGVRTPFTVTTTATVETGGTLLASRGGGFLANKLIANGTLNIDGGATGGQESYIAVGADGLELNGTLIQFNTGTAGAIAATSKGSVLVLGGDVKATGTVTLTNLTTIAGPISNVELVGDRTFTVADTMVVGTTTSPVNLVNDVLGTPGGLIKAGPGTLELAGNNTYTGPTDVTAGILALTGSITGSSNITVRSGAFIDASSSLTGLSINFGQTLSGEGNVVGAITMNGNLAPGDPGVFDIGNLKVNGFTFGIGSVADFNVTKIGGVLSSDVLTLSTGNTLVYEGGLQVSVSGSGYALGDSVTLFDADTYAGAFSIFNMQSPGPGLFWDATNLAVDGSITLVPEPTGCALLLGGLSLLAARRRRSR